jgi:hypothetical protein
MNREHVRVNPSGLFELSVGQLRNGNPSGNPSNALRCGACTQAGSPCQAPAIRGRRRCRLHGGLSTGPKTLAGIERIRAARTQHGRFSAESLAFERRRRGFFRDAYRSIRVLERQLGPGTIREDARRYLERIVEEEEAQGDRLPQCDEWRRETHDEVRRRDVERLRAKGLL